MTLALGDGACGERFGPCEPRGAGVRGERSGLDRVVVRDRGTPRRHTVGPAPFAIRLYAEDVLPRPRTTSGPG